MSQDEFLTVAEFSEKCGITKQAIYRRMSTTLKPFVKVLNGQKHLHISALKLFDSTPLFNDSTNVEQPLIDLLKEQLDLLQRQLEVKDRQIEELNRHLEQSLIRNHEGTVLVAQARALEAPKTVQKLSLFKRIFGNKNASQIE
jgi:hypothetical protein